MPSTLVSTIGDFVYGLSSFTVEYAAARILSSGRVYTQSVAGLGTASVEVEAPQGLIVQGDPCTTVEPGVTLSGYPPVLFDVAGDLPTSGSWLQGTVLEGVVGGGWSSFYCRFGE